MNAPQTLPRQPTERRGLVGPTILVALGVVFLLNNLGWLGGEIWEVLLRLWPILLIGVGLDLLIGLSSAYGSGRIGSWPSISATARGRGGQRQ